MRKVKEGRERERPFSVETKYKGYEDLLDVDEDDPDVIVPKDLQGSVRALNYALAHPLIFSEPHGTYKEKRVKKPQVSVRLSNNTLIDTPMSFFDSQYSKLDTWEYRLSLIESRETMFRFLLRNRYLMLTSIGNHARIKVPIWLSIYSIPRIENRVLMIKHSFIEELCVTVTHAWHHLHMRCCGGVSCK